MWGSCILKWFGFYTKTSLRRNLVEVDVTSTGVNGMLVSLDDGGKPLKSVQKRLKVIERAASRNLVFRSERKRERDLRVWKWAKLCETRWEKRKGPRSKACTMFSLDQTPSRKNVSPRASTALLLRLLVLLHAQRKDRWNNVTRHKWIFRGLNEYCIHPASSGWHHTTFRWIN